MTDLSDQLKSIIAKLEQNQQRDIHNSAQIYGVAAQAVDLNRQLLQTGAAQIPQEPTLITEALLKKRFKTAKAAAAALAAERGLQFQGRLLWSQVVAAWNQPINPALRADPVKQKASGELQAQLLQKLEDIETRLDQIEDTQQQILGFIKQFSKFCS
jgi:hypothetical protein